MIRQAKILPGQSLFDFSVQHTGNAENAHKIARLNNISVVDNIAAGTLLQIPADVDANVSAVTYFNVQTNKPATALTQEHINNTIGGDGIEFMAIEVDFVVS